MSRLCGRSAAHKAVIDQIPGVGPRPDLIFNELLGEYRRMIERDLVLRARRPYIVEEDIVQLAFLRSNVIMSQVVAAYLGDAKRFEFLFLFDR